MITIIGINKFVPKDSNKETIIVYYSEPFPDYCNNAAGLFCGSYRGYNNDVLDMLNVGDVIADFSFTKPFKAKDGKTYSFINGFVPYGSK